MFVDALKLINPIIDFSHWKGEARCTSVVRAFAHGAILHGVNPLSYFSFQPVLHDWCNKGHGMCYPVCGMVHIKEPLLLMERVAYVAAAGFLYRYQNGP